MKESPYGNDKQLALHVTDDFREGYICFDDTNRGHMIEVEIIETREHSFSFADKQGRLWKFEEVTIEEFKSNLYKYVENGQMIANICGTTEELWEYYRDTFSV